MRAPMRNAGRHTMRITKLLIPLAVGTVAIGSPALADHVFNTEIPFGSRGACEAEAAELDNGDREWLSEASGLSDGEIRSMLQRAWTCERGSDEQWYITDHRFEVLGSEWWLRRL